MLMKMVFFIYFRDIKLNAGETGIFIYFRDIKLNAGEAKPDNTDIDKLQKRLDKATNELKKLSEITRKSSKISFDAGARGGAGGVGYSDSGSGKLGGGFYYS